MTPEKIKQNAPKGATEYGLFCGIAVYYKNVDGVRMVYNHKLKGWDAPINYLKNIKPL